MKAFSVTEINHYIKKIFSADPILSRVLIEGEVSNMTLHGSGHLYFSLKDEGGKISAIMFADAVADLPVLPKEGDKVQALGKISIYEKEGKYQFYAQKMEWVGYGGLHVKKEQIRKKLENQGLFDAKRKKILPLYPEKIAIVTSATGAALADIKAVAKRKRHFGEVHIIPSLVQGLEAPQKMIKALKFADKGHYDVIILARGGGSLEELWAFNDEDLVQCIAQLNTPLVTGIGHEIDYTLADEVSDVRMPTPTAAAEFVFISCDEMERTIHTFLQRLYLGTQNQLNEKKTKLSFYTPKMIKKEYSRQIDDYKKNTDEIFQQLKQTLNQWMKNNHLKMEHYEKALKAYDPQTILERGYAIAYLNGKMITSIEEVKNGDQLKIMLSDGVLDVKILQSTKTVKE